MSHTIGIVCGHGETVALDNDKYSLLFAMLRDEHWRLDPLQEKLTTVALADCQALLIGGAREKLAPEEVQALRKWVAAGGSLLVLSSRDPTAPRWRGLVKQSPPPHRRKEPAVWANG